MQVIVSRCSLYSQRFLYALVPVYRLSLDDILLPVCKSCKLIRFKLKLSIFRQVKEVRHRNIMSVIKALEQPNVEIEQLIQQQKMRYESKYP